MDEIIELLRRLPKKPLCWQGALVPWPQLVRGEDGVLFRPHVPLWVDVESAAIHPGSLLEPGDDLFRASLLSLSRFVSKLLKGRCCPKTLEVRDPALADYLRAKLAGGGINVRLTDKLPVLDRVAAAMASIVQTHATGPPSLLDSKGVAIEHIHAFANASVVFYRAAPWRHLSDADLIHVESPKPPRGMKCLTVLGAGRSTYGMGLYASQAAYHRFVRMGQEGIYNDDITVGLTQVIFDSIEELPPADAELWTKHQLPTASSQAYPLPMKFLGKGEIGRPTKKELCFLEGLLRALAGTTEAEFDTGRWSKSVATAEGPLTITLAMPDLLDPPSPQEWIKRGFMPDPRAHERVFADMNRFLAQNPPDENEELEGMGRLFEARSLDAPLTQPRTAAELAQELCFQAFDVHGRRRVQLARQALVNDPDCADAHVVLAEQAGTLEDELDHFRRGMEAGERSLGPDCFANYAGEFWGFYSNRPYKRARLGLADSLVAAGRIDEAIHHYEELLRLNPNDNQGVRYLLLPKLLTVGRELDAAKLLKQFDEVSANWAYARALLAFRLSGRSEAANRELQSAARINANVPELLASDGPIPLPPHYALGSFEEACVTVDLLRPAFHATDGAVAWMIESLSKRKNDSDKLRRERRRKERAKQKKRKKR